MRWSYFTLFMAILIVGSTLAYVFWPNDTVFIFRAPPAKEFNITIYHTHFEPRSITVQHNDIVQLNIQTAPGTETYYHGLTIAEYGINTVVTQPTEIRFTADKIGTFVGTCASCANGPFGRDAPDKQLLLIVN